MKKSIYGMYKGAFLVSKAEIYIGEKENGEEFAQFSLLDVGQMHDQNVFIKYTKK